MELDILWELFSNGNYGYREGVVVIERWYCCEHVLNIELQIEQQHCAEASSILLYQQRAW